ncbi:MAG: hypothetical protein COB29_09115 [Sulfitobacter sp.]|nr:hypothetical protein [Roseobacter sp.]PHR07198.1 MAG: hypothetical protein COB29_09115 [Sulfitobacter sp.]
MLHKGNSEVEGEGTVKITFIEWGWVVQLGQQERGPAATYAPAIYLTKVFLMILSRILVVAALFSGLGTVPSIAETSAERQSLFQAMLRQPANTDLMLQYARQAVKDQDFEAAVATLERLVDRDPASVEARSELAAAYFALGANEVALYHLNILQGSDALTPDQQRQMARYAEEAQDRTATSSFSGFAQAGFAVLGDNGKVGATASMGLVHRYDPDGPGGTVFITTLRADYLDFGSSTTTGQRSIAFTYGPSLRLAGTQYGPVLRPYLAVRSTHDNKIAFDRDALGFGLSLEAPLTQSWSAFANLEGGRSRYDASTVDGNYVDGQLGLIWFPGRDASVRGSVISQNVDIADPLIESDFRAVRVDFQKRLRPSFAGHDWKVSGFVQTETDSFTSGREDKVKRVGAALQAYVTETVYINGEVQFYDRKSNVIGFEKSEPLFSMTVGMEF